MEVKPEIVNIKASDRDLAVEPSNGRNFSVSLGLFPRLLEASKEEGDIVSVRDKNNQVEYLG